MKILLLLSTALFLSQLSIAQNKPWKRHTIDASYSGADGVRLADVNDDQLMDIVTGWEEAGLTKIYLHPGYDKATLAWPSVIIGNTPSAEDAVFADLDQDGNMDVISSTEGKNRKMYIHWAPQSPANYLDSSQWKTQHIPASAGLMQWMFAIPMQIDGINGIDIVAGAKGKNAKVGWFEAPNDPRSITKWIWHPISAATWIMSLIARDMDGDGDLDIVLSDRKAGKTNGVRWLENPGKLPEQKQLWESHIMGCQNLEVMFMTLADLDGDGLEDAIVTERSSQKIVFLKRLNSSGLKWESFEINIPEFTGSAKAVKVGDIDRDGKLDLVHTTNTHKKAGKSGIYWLSVKASPTESDWDWHELSGPEGYKFDRIELLDLDGDDDLDVLTCEENFGSESEGLGVIWYENPFSSLPNNKD